MALGPVFAVFAREMRGFFAHPIAYAALTVFLGLLAGFSLWFDDVLLAGAASMRRPFSWMAACLVVLVPAVTMRLLAEERRAGTLQLLLTLPITAAEVVVGKWLAATALVAIALALTCPWPAALWMLGPLDWGPVAAGYLGLLLAGGAFAAIGTAASALSESQVVAFLASCCACLAPWAAGWALPALPAPDIVQYVTFTYHFSNLARGVIDTRSVVFFAAVAVCALRIAILALEHRRLA